MKKKMLILGMALIMLCTAAVVVFAEAGVSYTNNSVTVWNIGSGRIPSVELCVIYMDAANVRRETSMSFSNVTPRQQTKPFNLGKVIGAYSTYCAVPVAE